MASAGPRAAPYVVIVLTTLVLGLVAGCDPDSGSPSPGRGPDDGPLVLGPDGVGPLRLGMTAREIAGTGAATTAGGGGRVAWTPGCEAVRYRVRRLGRTPGNTLSGAVSPRQGLEALFASDRMVTPEGIRLGSPIADVRQAYGMPNLNPGQEVVVGASMRAVYRIDVDRVVTSISVQVREPDCYIDSGDGMAPR